MFYPHRTGSYTSLPCVNVPDKEVCIFHKISDSAPQAAVYHDPQWCTKHTMDSTEKCLSDKKADANCFFPAEAPADIRRSFRREKTVCICLFIRQTLLSTVHCMLCAPLGIVVHSSLRSTVRNFVKNTHFFIRNIYTWQGGITPCSVWIKHFRRYLKCGKI